jgi:sec-independent protein translocase protein TatA
MFEGLFQPMHVIIILAIALIIFGPGKLPELGKGLGKSIREFKTAMSDAINHVHVTKDVKEITSAATSEMIQEAATKEAVEAKNETAS